MRRKIRSAGVIFLELEKLYNELIDDHGFQWGDLLWNLYGWLKIHRKDAREEYLDGTFPKFEYESEE